MLQRADDAALHLAAATPAIRSVGAAAAFGTRDTQPNSLALRVGILSLARHAPRELTCIFLLTTPETRNEVDAFLEELQACVATAAPDEDVALEKTAAEHDDIQGVESDPVGTDMSAALLLTRPRAVRGGAAEMLLLSSTPPGALRQEWEHPKGDMSSTT